MKLLYDFRHQGFSCQCAGLEVLGLPAKTLCCLGLEESFPAIGTLRECRGLYNPLYLGFFVWGLNSLRKGGSIVCRV